MFTLIKKKFEKFFWKVFNILKTWNLLKKVDFFLRKGYYINKPRIFFKKKNRSCQNFYRSSITFFLWRKFLGVNMGRGQVVRQRFLAPPFVGSNPSAPDLILFSIKKEKSISLLKIQFLFKFFHFFKNSLKKFFINKNKMIALFFFFSIFISKTKLVQVDLCAPTCTTCCAGTFVQAGKQLPACPA